MSATTATRYDFGRCTVEDVGRRDFRETQHLPHETVATFELQQSHGGDQALFMLLAVDARELANKILELLDG